MDIVSVYNLVAISRIWKIYFNTKFLGLHNCYTLEKQQIQIESDQQSHVNMGPVKGPNHWFIQ